MALNATFNNISVKHI